MITPELKIYIAQSKQSGMSDTEIKNQLLSKGWKESDLNEALQLRTLPPPISGHAKTLWDTSSPIATAPLTGDNSIFFPTSQTSDIKGKIVGQYVLIAISILAFMPLYFGFLRGFIENYSLKSAAYSAAENYNYQQEQNGMVSAVLFIGFFASLIFKLLIQAFLLSKINFILKNSAQPDAGLQRLIERFKKSRVFYYVFHVFVLSALLPFFQLLTVWIAVPIGFGLLGVYAERKFFYETSAYLRQSNINLNTFSLTVALIIFYIMLLLLFAAIAYGIGGIGAGS